MLPVVIDQPVGRRVVIADGFRCMQLTQHFFCQLLAQFHAPLIKRIDIPQHALDEDLVFVQRNQRAEAVRSMLLLAGVSPALVTASGNGNSKYLDGRVEVVVHPLISG